MHLIILHKYQKDKIIILLQIMLIMCILSKLILHEELKHIAIIASSLAIAIAANDSYRDVVSK